MRTGSDIVEAMTCYCHREKLRLIGKEEILEPLNRQAVRCGESRTLEKPTKPFVAPERCVRRCSPFNQGAPVGYIYLADVRARQFRGLTSREAATAAGGEEETPECRREPTREPCTPWAFSRGAN